MSSKSKLGMLVKKKTPAATASAGSAVPQKTAAQSAPAANALNSADPKANSSNPNVSSAPKASSMPEESKPAIVEKKPAAPSGLSLLGAYSGSDSSEESS